MGRCLRRHEPGQFHLVTTRCHQARFFLRPDRELNATVLEWLARAQMAFPEVRLYAVIVMSNHLHLVVRDQQGELAAWASFFLGNLARAVNRIRGRSGTFFERRYDAAPILDEEALVDRLVYVVTNPVKAGLCGRVEEWSGVVLWARGDVALERRVSWIDREAQRRARSGTPERGRAEVLTVHGQLRVEPLPTTRSGSRDVAELVRAREEAIARERKRAPLTRAQILAQRWQAVPRHAKRTPRPFCHASDAAQRRAFIEGFHEFVARFRDASLCLRGGMGSVLFPDWSYPPGQPIVRPILAETA